MSVPGDSSSFPSNLARQSGLLAQHDWWSYRQLRDLWEFLVKPDCQLWYISYYHPVILLSNQLPPHLQVGSELYFEWLAKDSNLVIITFHIIINSLIHTCNAIFKISGRSYKPYPLITCIWHDRPSQLDTCTSHFINFTLLNTWGGSSHIDTFDSILEELFITCYHPVTPQLVPQNLWPHHPTSPYYIPHQSSEASEDQ